MATEWLNKFVSALERVLDKPPYLIFVFIGAVFVIISLITRYEFQHIWIFFIYAVTGAVWRYIERDFFRPLEKYSKSRLVIISIYHVGNLLLIIGLLRHLKFL